MQTEFIEKLALGTVQFGLNYGVANQSGQVSKDEVSSESQNDTEYDIINNYNDFKKALNKYNKSFIDRRECIILRSIDNIKKPRI